MEKAPDFDPPDPERLTALLGNQLHQLCYGCGMGSKQVGESLRERGKAKLKSGGESHLRHRAMAIEKEVCTLSPHQLHHSPGHGKEPGAMKGVREYFGELATGNRIGTGTDEWACNGFLIQGVQDQAGGIIDMNP